MLTCKIVCVTKRTH